MASRKLWVHYRPQRANGQMGGTLLWALSLRETVVNYAALNWITFLPVMDELDDEPTIKEFVLVYPQIKAENWTHLNNEQSGNNTLMTRDHILLRWGLIFFPSIPVFNCFACRKTFPLFPGFVCKRFRFITAKIYCTNNKNSWLNSSL